MPLSAIKTLKDHFASDIKLICLRENKGKGFALRVGLTNANNDKILIYDSDMEYILIDKQTGSIFPVLL